MKTKIELEEELSQQRLRQENRRDQGRTSERRSAPRPRNRGYALEEMETLSDSEFTRMFRLNREAYYWLMYRIDNQLKPIDEFTNLSAYNDFIRINNVTRLAVTLRWLAGGSYLDICFAFGISTGTFFLKWRNLMWYNCCIELCS